MKNFWKELPRPFSVLAPMEDVTDTVFRRVVSWCAPPDVYFTEFTSTDGLCSVGRDRVIHRLQYTETEKPLVAQIWGKYPEKYYETAKLLTELGFDGIDINLGCPVQKITKNGCCSALIDNPSLVAELYAATVEGAPTLPVSVKTRLGFKTKVTEPWTEFLLSLKPAVLTMHGRTAKQMSKVPANWNEIRRVVELRDQAGSDTIIVGNGDVKGHAEILSKAEEYGVDGVMIGRGVFDDLYAFSKDPDCTPWAERPAQEKLELLKQHLTLHRSIWSTQKPYSQTKKFFKIYASHYQGASELRNALVHTENLEEALQIIEDFLSGETALDQAVGA